MRPTATADLTAHINGVDYKLAEGDEFAGDARAASVLAAEGLLEEPAEDDEDPQGEGTE